MRKEEIFCGIEGEVVDIRYGDAEIGITDRIVTIECLYQFAGEIYFDGFCHLRADTRTFRLDRLHKISELPNGAYYFSAREWLESYGLKVEMFERGGRWRYRLKT